MWQMLSFFMFIRTIWSFLITVSFVKPIKLQRGLCSLKMDCFVCKIGTREANWEWMKSQLLNEPRGQSRRWGDIMTWSPRLYQCWHIAWFGCQHPGGTFPTVSESQLTGVMDNIAQACHHHRHWEIAKLSPFELKMHDNRIILCNILFACLF